MIHWIRSKIRENNYHNSEHIIRYLSQRIFSLQDIENILLTGNILETHSHPLRNDSYLLSGCSGTKPIHVMCTKDDNNNLIVLYAYVPSSPIWKDDKTRIEAGGHKMDKNLVKCFFCNSKIEPISIGNFDFRWEGGLYVIKNVPAGLCIQCGEKYISSQASKKIVAMIENENFTDKDEVLVFEYEK